MLRDGDTVRRGEVILTAYRTLGHTKGATTWVTTLVDGGKAYKVVFPDGGGSNPGYHLVEPESYTGINQDYRYTLHFLESLRPDIWGGHHTEYFDLEGKRKRAATEGANAWVDPEGYRRFIASKRRAFEDEVDAELGVKKSELPQKAIQANVNIKYRAVTEHTHSRLLLCGIPKTESAGQQQVLESGIRRFMHKPIEAPH